MRFLPFQPQRPSPPPDAQPQRVTSRNVRVVVDPLCCVDCGRPLLGDPEDDPTGEGAQPICGECNRARNMDAELEYEDRRDHDDDA